METFSALLSLCAGNSLVTGEFHAQRAVTRSFDVFFDLRLNKLLNKQLWGWWSETPSHSLWHHCNGLSNYIHRFSWNAITHPCLDYPSSVGNKVIDDFLVNNAILQLLRILACHGVLVNIFNSLWLFHIFVRCVILQQLSLVTTSRLTTVNTGNIKTTGVLFDQIYLKVTAISSTIQINMQLSPGCN